MKEGTIIHPHFGTIDAKRYSIHNVKRVARSFTHMQESPVPAHQLVALILYASSQAGKP